MREIRDWRWGVYAEEPQTLARLQPLIEARRRIGPVHVGESVADALRHADSVLVVGGGIPDAVAMNAEDGRRVPVGWVSDHATSLGAFVRNATQVVQRAQFGWSAGPAVLLGQWDDRALTVADEIESACEAKLIRWTAERLVRRDLIDGLRCGPGLALYVGHALSGGWVGYGGVPASALGGRRAQPLGSIVSVACDAGRWHAGKASFCDELVGQGTCASALGATGKTLHAVNRVLARSLARGLGHSVHLGELLLQVPDEVLAHYRIAGDPAAPLIGAERSLEICRGVFAPAPDDLLELAALPLASASQAQPEVIAAS
jgi:hypothetical protein